LIAGILDITSAFVIAAIKGVGAMRMLQGLTSGLIGAKSFDGGPGNSGVRFGHPFP